DALTRKDESLLPSVSIRIGQRGDTAIMRPVRRYSRPLHPVHAIFLAFPLPLFLGALLSDLAYGASYQIQWINFASWLIAGGLLVGAFALLWAVLGVFRGRSARTGRSVVYLLVLLAMWVRGLVNALVHGKDAWATMPVGLYLS